LFLILLDCSFLPERSILPALASTAIVARSRVGDNDASSSLIHFVTGNEISCSNSVVYVDDSLLNNTLMGTHLCTCIINNLMILCLQARKEPIFYGIIVAASRSLAKGQRKHGITAVAVGRLLFELGGIFRAHRWGGGGLTL
jgi:hypothetical protein